MPLILPQRLPAGTQKPIREGKRLLNLRPHGRAYPDEREEMLGGLDARPRIRRQLQLPVIALFGPVRIAVRCPAHVAGEIIAPAQRPATKATGSLDYLPAAG